MRPQLFPPDGSEWRQESEDGAAQLKITQTQKSRRLYGARSGGKRCAFRPYSLAAGAAPLAAALIGNVGLFIE